MAERVVVTGLGWVTPFGEDIEAVWQKVLAGQVSVDRLRLDSSSPTAAAAEVGDDILDRVRARLPEAAGIADRRSLLAFAAGAFALENAGLDARPEPRAGVVLGSGPGAHDFALADALLQASGGAEEAALQMELGSRRKEGLPFVRAEEPAARLAARFGLGGPVHAITTACAASNQALGLAWRLLRRNEAEWMLAGGADSMLNPQGLVFFVLLGANARVDAADPSRACRPFDRRRSGLVMGEGAACLVLETLTHARARGARILAEVLGYGSSLDAWRMTAPPPDGRGAAAAMLAALQSGGIPPERVDFVNAHGTGTKRNDPAELTAVRSLFDHGPTRPSVSSGKGALGHLLAAAAGVAAVCTVLALRDQVVPPTANLEEPEGAEGLDLVAGKGRERSLGVALTNAFAFGGQNAVLALGRFEEGIQCR